MGYWGFLLQTCEYLFTLSLLGPSLPYTLILSYAERRIEHFRIVRAVAFVALIAFEIAGTLTAPNATSFLAHATGFALGLAPSMLVLSHSGNEYLDAIIPILAVIDFLIVSVVLPICVFHSKLPGITCN